MKSFLQWVLAVSILFLIPENSTAQAPDLGTTSSFAMFTAVGAFNNTGASLVTGDIGTDVGAFSGFPPGVVIGNIHVADAVTAQAAIDVALAYSDLSGLTCGQVIGTTLGGGQILTPDIYCLGAASVLNGDLVLDGQCDPDAFFIFKIDGALSTAVLASVTLINGASWCNVYWQVNGAVSIGEGAVFRGTIIAAGAITLLEGSSLYGRGLTTAGAIEMHNNIVSLEMLPTASIVVAEGPTTFCAGDSVTLSGNCGGTWNTGDTTSTITVSTSGDYFITNANGCGTAESNHIIVTVNAAPDCTITGVFSLCAGQTTELCVAVGYASYLWSTGSTLNCITVGSSGTYSVTITDADGCTSTCSQIVSIEDLVPPTITCPINISIECDVDTQPIVTGTAIASDDCDPAPVVAFSDATIGGLCAQDYTITRTWIATDASGNTATCVQTISLADNTPPVITCPTIVSTIECGSIPSFETATAIDACDVLPLITFSDITTSGVCPQEYSVTRTWIATDDCGNSSSCSATIFVQDNTAPVITCPIVVSPIECGSTPSFGTATATDACDGQVAILFTDVTIPGICTLEYTITRTWTATDDCGNTATCSRTIEVGGSTGLIITCPPAVTVPCASLVPAIDITLVQASGNCGILTISHLSDVISNQTCLNSYTLTRTYQAMDECGNSASCSQIIAVLDDIAPVITFTNPLIANGDTLKTQCYGQDPEWDIPSFESGNISAVDECGGEVTITYARTLEGAGNCTEDGYINLYRMTWTATDECGNSSSAFAFLALVDTIYPVIFGIPADTIVNCDDVPPPPSVYARDECLCVSIVMEQQFDSTQAQCLDGLVILRIWTALDDCGNVTIDTQRITLIDQDGPELFFLEPEMEGLTDGSVIEYNCNDGGIPDYFDNLDAQSITARGTCGGSYDLSFTEEVDIQTNCEFFGYLEERIYHWTGTDLCSNMTSLTITVRLIDNEAPVITGVPDTACIGDVAFDNIEVTDDCDNVSLRYWDVNIPNPCGEGTARRRTYEATDECGNMALDTTILLPNSLAVPVIFFTNPLLMQMDSGMVMTMDCEAGNQRYTTFGVSDVRVEGACSTSSLVGFSETLLSSGDCADGGFVAVVELKWTATDICGNYGERLMRVNIIDESNPVFVNFTPVLYVGCNDSIPEMAATDNCGEVIMTHTDLIIPGPCEYKYDIERLVTATDICGNTITRLQIIHVGNIGGPVITGVIEEICDDLTIPVVTAYDECTDEFVEVTMQQDTLDVTCRDGLVIQRTWTAIDACGDTTVIRQTIILNDHTPPVIYIPTYSVILRFLDRENNLVYQSQTGIIKLLNELNDESVQVYDDCDQVIIPVLTTDTLVALDCELAGYAYRVIYTWTATDICGNTASITFTVDIMDDMVPVFIEMPTDTMIICAPLPPVPNVVLLDSLENVTIVYTETIVSGPGVGQFTVTRTWTATDSCNNVTTYIQHILWQPESTLECTIILPEVVQCDAHGNIITSVVIGGSGDYIYEWEVVGEDCFIKGGQGTPELEIYMGWADVKIILTVTDTFGCVTMCMTFLHCIEVFELQIPADVEAGTSLVLPEYTETSPTIHTENETISGIQKFTLWPNPAKETINIGFESGREGMVEYSVLDYLGQTLSTNRILAHQGYNIHQVDATILSSGSYLIQLRSEAEFYTKGIMIIRNE